MSFLYLSPMVADDPHSSYEDKVVTNGTTARMVLLFLRELLEHLPVGERAQQTYTCPMAKCPRTFLAPLQVIQHLVSCPELSNGEFGCDKCDTWHSFPTNEKDWAQWTGWRSPSSVHPIQRKRSLGSKMKETFALRKKDPLRKQNPMFDQHFKTTYPTDTRPSTAASEAPSTTFTNGAFAQHVVFPTQPGRRLPFSEMQKPMLPGGLPNVNGDLFWPGFDHTSDLPSTVSSVVISSSTIDDTTSERFSQNTSQTTLFNSGLGPYQSPVAAARDSSKTLEAPHFIFPSQAPFGQGLTSLPVLPSCASAMALDEPAPVNQTPLSPSEIDQTIGDRSQAWWGGKVEVATPQMNAQTSGPGACFPLQTPMAGMLPRGTSSAVSSPSSPCGDASPFYQIPAPTAPSISRALSNESMQTGITTAFGTPTPETTGAGPLSPHGDNSKAQHSVAAPPGVPPESSVEDLVCDECQWKPRGVRENLKGYLRKHKNTHKGVRLACDVPGCVKTFSRLDNLKKHKKDKHGIEDTGSTVPAKRVAGDLSERGDEETEPRRPITIESEIRGPTEDYSMLWPALHF